MPAFALVLRTDDVNAPVRYASVLALYVVVVSLARFIVFYQFGLYSRYWRYASVDELGQIFIAVAIPTGLMSVAFWWVIPAFNLFENDLPRSIPCRDDDGARDATQPAPRLGAGCVSRY